MFELPYRPGTDVQRQDSIQKLYTYDPMSRFREVVGDVIEQAPKNAIVLRNWHPGYVDYYVCEQGDHGPWAKNFLDCRCYDMHMLCSQELRDCIKEHEIELVNMRDAIRGTREYQNCLKSIGSDLAV